jgi:hypothetical protein
MLRIPHCLDNRLTDGGNVVSPTIRPHFTLQKHLFFCFWNSFLLEVGQTPGPSEAGRIFKSKKFSSSGLEPAAFRLVAYCFNHYATTWPTNCHVKKISSA